jgi:GNAT superfamily N-acetyltransferase
MKINPLKEQDIPNLVSSFAAHNWPKPRAIFEKYLEEQEACERKVWVAYFGEELAGYVTLKKHSYYPAFREQNIPEIMDLNVLPPYRNKGIGSKLLEMAEKEAFKQNNVVGIGVGLYEGYGNAQKLYIAKGYVPDGLGITHNYQRVAYGEKVPLDDDLVLWFTKITNIG